MPDWSQRRLLESLIKIQIHRHYADWWNWKLRICPRDILNKIPVDSDRQLGLRLTAVSPSQLLFLHELPFALDIPLPGWLIPKVWLKVELFLTSTCSLTTQARSGWCPCFLLPWCLTLSSTFLPCNINMFLCLPSWGMCLFTFHLQHQAWHKAGASGLFNEELMKPHWPTFRALVHRSRSSVRVSNWNRRSGIAFQIW